LMNAVWMRDALSDAKVRVESGLLEVHVPAHTIWVLRPESLPEDEYNPYKRVQ